MCAVYIKLDTYLMLVKQSHEMNCILREESPR